MYYLTYAEYLEWRRGQDDVRDNEPAEGLNIDGGGFDPWTDDVTYTGGSEESGGYLSEDDYAVIEMKARKIIDWWTDMRVADMAEVPDEVKLCSTQTATPNPTALRLISRLQCRSAWVRSSGNGSTASRMTRACLSCTGGCILTDEAHK